MRVCLGRALFADADVLLLDEPTNHLDLKAINWLTAYLVGDTKVLGRENALRLSRDKIVIIVSHSRDFLNDVRLHFIAAASFRESKLIRAFQIKRFLLTASACICYAGLH